MDKNSSTRFPASFSDRKSKACAELRRSIENLKWLGLSVITFLVCGAVAQVQQPKQVYKIEYLTATSLSAIAARTEAFRQGLRELGYVEGKNIVIEQRHAEGKLDRLPALATELVRLNVDVIGVGRPRRHESCQRSD